MRQSTQFGVISALSLAFAAVVHTDSLDRLLGVDDAMRAARLKYQAIEACSGSRLDPAVFKAPRDKACVSTKVEELKAAEQNWSDFSALALLLGAGLSGAAAVGARRHERRREDNDNNGPQAGL